MAASNVPRSRRRKRNPKPSTVRRRRLHEQRKAALIEDLGGRCEVCQSTENLTFDHVHGRDWDIAAVHSSKRMRLYMEEAEKGDLQLLCLSCNSAKQDKPNDEFMAQAGSRAQHEEYTEGVL